MRQLSGIMDDLATQERYRALLLAARNLFSLTSLDDLVENILKYSCTMMQAEACSMYLPDKATRELIIYSARGKDDAINAFRIPWDKGIAGTVFQQRKFMRIDDAQNDPRLLRSADQKTGFVTRSMLCAPLVDKNDCFGVLQALNPVGRAIFTQLDEDIFEGLTNIVTGALVRFDRELKIDKEAKLEREMTLAMEIQKSYLPPEELSLPRSEMRVRYRPARTIGGDFYASIELPDGRLLAALGDVSGKGIPAALTTAQITTEMQALCPAAEQGTFAPTSPCAERSPLQAIGRRPFCRHHIPAARSASRNDGDHLRRTIRAVALAQRHVGTAFTAPVHALALGHFPGPEQFESEITEVPCQPGEKWLHVQRWDQRGPKPRRREEYGLAERLRAKAWASAGAAANVLAKAAGTSCGKFRRWRSPAR